MSCVEKRHMSHRMGSMLHHRFPNGFSDLFMDETDREVSTLTDRAFRSLCVGDDAVYNDEFLYGYSPFSCHKPLVGERLKKNHKESKKAGQNKHDKSDAQKNISNMSSFLKALSVAEGSCEGMLIRNGGMADSNGESWDKSALRSIQRELSEFSSDYHTGLADRHYNNNQSGDGLSNKTGKDASHPSGKLTKMKNGKSTIKLKKLNITNFFLHSELSPFQTWRDFNQYPFAQEDAGTTILSADNTPKWYDLPFYKELTQAHRQETVHTEETHTCHKEANEPSPPSVLQPVLPPPPPKVLPKPSAILAEKRCSSDGGDGTAAPWRRNRSRAKSAIPANQPGRQPQEGNRKPVDESLLLVKKEVKSVEVKSVEEVSSLASTPFSICQLMTPVIPSRQPTETSEILQAVLSPSVLDLPGRPQSEAKVTPEPPVKRESYKSLASSILFNLKDNRKRVKSRYSPPKFKTVEMPEDTDQSPQLDVLRQAGSDGYASGLSTPAILKDGQPVCSPILEPVDSLDVDHTKRDSEHPLTDDYLLANLLHAKWDTAEKSSHGEESVISPFKNPKANKNPMAKKQNYPSLNLYKKASAVDSDVNYLQLPPSAIVSANTNSPTETKDRLLSPKDLPTNTKLSPSALHVIEEFSPLISPHMLEMEGLSSQVKRPPNIPEKAKSLFKNTKEKDSGAQPTERESGGQTMSTMEVIRAAREAINATKSKARSAGQTNSVSKEVAEKEELRKKGTEDKVSKERRGSKREHFNPESDICPPLVGKVNKEPPPVPKRNFAISDIQLPLDKRPTNYTGKVPDPDLPNAKLDLPSKENKLIRKQDKLNRVFSSTQNNYIKTQRYAVVDDKPAEEYEEGNPDVNTRMETDKEMTPCGEMRDSGHIINDLQALKELERARLGDRMLENAKSKLEVVSIDEEAKAKNDLISRELRNIKRGMLSMRGNTSAKREIFAKKEKEKSKPEGFAKLDSTVIVNKALINANYDKAKMALEEIISERERKRSTFADQDGNSTSGENFDDTNLETRTQQGREAAKECTKAVSDKQNSSDSVHKETDLKERLEDFRDHNQLRKILSQTEPRLGETHRSGGRIALPGMDKISNELNKHLKTKPKHMKDNLSDNKADNSEVIMAEIARQSEESGEYFNESEGKKIGTPSVPPRSKKGGNKRDGAANKETDWVDETAFTKHGVFKKHVEPSNNRTTSEIREKDHEEAMQNPSKTYSPKDRQEEEHQDNVESISVTKGTTSEPDSIPNFSQSQSILCLSPRLTVNENNNLEVIIGPKEEGLTETVNNAEEQETHKIKRRAPLKPEHLISADANVTISPNTQYEPDKVSGDPVHVDAEALSETLRNTVSPLQLLNSVSVPQSPPESASLSSKSSYFSVESALHRNMETESNIYHSLENLTGDMEEVDEARLSVSQKDSDRAEAEYYSLSDQECEPDGGMRQVRSPQKEPELQHKYSTDRDPGSADQTTTPVEQNSDNAFSPTFEIPALFKVKNNIFGNKPKKVMPPWSPRRGQSGSEAVEEESNQAKENPELLFPVAKEAPTADITETSTDILKPEEILSNLSPSLPSTLQSENSTRPQVGGFLTVPQEEERFLRVTPSSEGVESTADAPDEEAMIADVPAEHEGTKVPSERSGSTCSGNDSQTGLPKPPAVLPKSEKAVLKAIKLANRRMKKEEAQKSSHKSSQGSSKHKVDRPKSDKSEHKGSSGAKVSRSSEKKHRERSEEAHNGRHNDHRHRSNSNVQGDGQQSSHGEKRHQEKRHEAQGRGRNPEEHNNRSTDVDPGVTPERQGRSGDRRVRDKPEQRHYSSDRIISNVPVYKAHVEERPPSDRPFNRSQSIDRYLGAKVERRLSADVAFNEKPDPRTQRIEKSIMEELAQRGRARDKAGRDNPVRRSHSIDAHCIEVPHPSSLSRQSSHTSHTSHNSHTSQLSRQSSIEHTIVTQSFPMTQRKLLQDPESGQYFFVDLPVQVKTKTFFDPETGSYVQLPVKPTDGAVPQPSPMEVLTPPMVVYHSFVPVPLSPMAQKTTIQKAHVEQEEFEQRHMERARQMHCKEGHPYLEPAYGQHDHMLGEFMGTEELDCPS
ncbi:unnamed protein product [Menidia menidia]|uniref:(Atlantic silverside) hypothetical protein n=1 Tax=Menidia menidia TaxID=238744 RepID=A0A8S4B1C4_9TELE|nr:unnamed protein product [Menidia menidia]